MGDLQWCARCGEPRGYGHWICVACGYDRWVDRPPPGVEVRAPPREYVPTGGPLGAVIDPGTGMPFSLPWGKVMLLYGPKGGGKTSVAMQMLPEADWLTTEMDDLGLREYASRLGTRVGFVREPQWSDEYERPILPLDRGTDQLVVDSLTAFSHDIELGLEVVEWAKQTGGRAIVITHETVDGKPWGGTKIPHMVWQIVHIGWNAQGQRELHTEKNRSGSVEVVATFELDEVDDDASNMLYSVEGKRGHFRLAEWPADSGARRADVLNYRPKAPRLDKEGDVIQEGEAPLDLPDPPFAVAAKRSIHHRGGWVEPADWRRRCEFAHQQGVPYWSPVHGLILPPPAPEVDEASEGYEYIPDDANPPGDAAPSGVKDLTTGDTAEFNKYR